MQHSTAEWRRMQNITEHTNTQTVMLEKTYFKPKALFHCREIICPGFQEDRGKILPNYLVGEFGFSD